MSATTERAESFTDTWTYVNQIESLLEVILEESYQAYGTENPEGKQEIINRMSNLILTTKTVADSLARLVYVR